MEAPAWIEKLLRPLNEFMERVYQTLDRGVAFGENVASSVREIEFRTDALYSSGEFDVVSFQSGLRTRAQACVPLQAFQMSDNDPVLSGPVWFDWRENRGQVQIRWISGLNDSTRYRIRVLVF